LIGELRDVRGGDRARALVGLAPYLPSDLLAQALEAATAINNSYPRAEALTGLVPYLPADQRGPVLARALDAATAVDRPEDRAKALAGLVPLLPADRRGPVLAQALENASLVGRTAVVDVFPDVLTLMTDPVIKRTAASALLHVQRWWP
jgi:hypothetical protein